MNEATNHKWVGLQLTPLDVLFFRDGRPFDAANRVEGGLPNPQTLAGALRTALLAKRGFDFRAFAKDRQQLDAAEALRKQDTPEWIIQARFRGPWLAKKDSPNEPLLPIPATLTAETNREGKVEEWFRSKPLKHGELPGWHHPEHLRPLWRKQGADTKPPGGYLTLEGIQRFLQGERPGPQDHCSTKDLYEYDHRVGIKVDGATFTAEEGQLYGIRFLALNQEICLYAETLSGPDAPEPATWFAESLPLGGEGKYVNVKPLKQPASWPQPSAVNGKSVWLLAAPAFVGEGKRWPDGLSGLQAAASADPLAVSGWDMARGGPQATRFAVPAGGVYFVEGDLTPAYQSLCTDPEHVAQGWGFALRGVWNDE